MSSEESEEGRRKNGLEPPYHELQVGTWLLFPVVLSQYYGLLLPLLWLDLASQVIPTVFFTLSSVAAFYATYMTCSIDPADDALITPGEAEKHSCAIFSNPTQSEAKTIANEDSEQKDPNTKIFCYICDDRVHEHSRHCRYCNKCVQRFDHHCKWLNTCVGEKNYKYFLLVVGSVSFLTTISLVVSCVLLVEAYAYSDVFERRVTQAPGSLISPPLAKYFMIVSVAVLLGLVIMLYQLSLFHFTLVRRGLTTYDFIVMEQKRAREREEQRKQRRANSTNKPTKSRQSSPRVDSNNNTNIAKDVGSYRSWSNSISRDNTNESAIGLEENKGNEIELTSVGP